MKTKHTLLALANILFFTLYLHAQTPVLEWAKHIGGTLNDRVGGNATDIEGNIYTTGSFDGNLDFDPDTGASIKNSVGRSDIFIQKLDGNGKLIWVQTFGSSESDFGRSICTDKMGNIYITGIFQGTIDFDSDTGTASLMASGGGYADIFILKLDKDGNYIWVKSISGSSSKLSYSITTDIQGNVFTIGYFFKQADFDPGPNYNQMYSNGSTDIFIQKLDSNGNYIWAKRFGASGFDVGQSITTDKEGNVLAIGNFANEVDFDPNTGSTLLTSHGSGDVFVLKLDTAGSLVWVKQMGGLSNDQGLSLCTDTYGNIFTTGYFYDSADFDPGIDTVQLYSKGSYDVFIQKLDSNGNFKWVKQLGGTGPDQGYSIKVDSKGNLYSTGYFQGTVDFDPGPGTTNFTSVANSYDIFIQKLDTDGEYLWTQQMGGDNEDQGISIALDTTGNIFTTGTFRGTADFDPSTGTTSFISLGQGDIFIQKLSQCTPTSETFVIAACDSFTWIDGNTYHTTNNTAKDTLINVGGCDSFVTLNLTINHVSDLSTSLIGTTLTANNNNATHVWLNCDQNYSPIASETNQSFTATANGRYAVELTENNCVDTSACVAVYPVGLNPISLTDHFVVYPNPTNGKFTIQFKSPHESINIRILSPEGQEIESKRFQNTKHIQMVLNQSNGIYFLEITDLQSNTSILKLIKE